MNVLFLSTWFPYPPDNGSKLRTYHLLHSLSQAHEVFLLSFAFGTATPTDPGPLAGWCTHIDVVALDPFAANEAGVLRTFLSPIPVSTRPLPTMQQRVDQAWRERSFEATIASTEVMAAYTLSAPPNTVKVLEEHNSLTRWMQERHATQAGMAARLRCRISWLKARRYEARLFPRFDLVTMVSEQDRAVAQLLPGYHGHVEVVPNGVDCAHNRLNLAQPRPGTLVFNGSLTYSANYDAMQWFLAEIWPRIRAQVPDATLAITGATSGVDLAGLTLDDHVRLTGYVDDVRIPVAGAAVAVAPIRQGGGTRLKILEAMALGTPVVATTKGAEGLDVVDDEHFLRADDPHTFAARTVLLLQNADLRHRLANNARHLVETTYDWSQIGARFVTLVESAVENAHEKLA